MDESVPDRSSLRVMVSHRPRSHPGALAQTEQRPRALGMRGALPGARARMGAKGTSRPAHRQRRRTARVPGRRVRAGPASFLASRSPAGAGGWSCRFLDNPEVSDAIDSGPGPSSLSRRPPWRPGRLPLRSGLPGDARTGSSISVRHVYAVHVHGARGSGRPVFIPSSPTVLSTCSRAQMHFVHTAVDEICG